jgi:hypothetical protein
MSDNTENTQKMSFDSSTAVVSTSHALRLGMPTGLRQKVVFLSGDTVLGCEFTKNKDHAQELLAQAQKKLGSAKLSMIIVEPRVTPRALRGSNGRPKPYTPAKDKNAKAAKAAEGEKKAKKAA